MNRGLVDLMMNFCVGREVVVLGDFNLPSLVWPLENLFDNYISPVDRIFLDCFVDLGLTQWVEECTFISSGNVLDLFFTSENDRVGDVVIAAPFPRCAHSPVVCDVLFRRDFERHVDEERQRYLWFRGDFTTISESLSEVDWGLEFAYLSVNDSFSLLQSILISLVDEHVPRQPTTSAVPWAVRPPRWLSAERAEAWGLYKALRSDCGRNDGRSVGALEVFKQVNTVYRNFVFQSRLQCEEFLLTVYPESPKLFHAYIRKKKRGALSVGPLRLPCGRVIDDSQQMSEIFVSSFASVFVGGVPVDPSPGQRFIGQMRNFVVSLQDVHSILLGLDESSAMGLDGLHPKLLKSCADQLALPLYLIFNQSLISGVLPDMWKQSLVIPLYKSKSRYDPLNYRPVSLTSVCCKSMERVLASYLTEYLESNDILSPHQFGFRRHRSTEDQLLLTYADVAEWVDEGMVVDVVLLDFSKAFDVVSHVVLLSKLQDLGVVESLIRWIHSFLTGRTMSVGVDGCASTTREVRSGVPQGSVLGPILFLVYINSVTSGVVSSFKAFADDYKLYLRFPCRDTSAILQGMDTLQGDIDTVSSVARSWNLCLNPQKCVVMRFHRGVINWGEDGTRGYTLDQTALEFVESHRDLGVIVDTKLRFHQHIRVTVSKAAGLASSLLRSTVNRSPEFMVTICDSYSTNLGLLLHSLECGIPW
jgi:hypothetical protein